MTTRPSDIWQIAESLSAKLSSTLAHLEIQAPHAVIPPEGRIALEAAIRVTWDYVIARARDSRVSLTPEFVLSIHSKLATPIGALGVGCFDAGLPPQDWPGFQQSVQDSIDEWGADDVDGWIVAQLYHGNHLQSLMLSTAWLLVNAIRLQVGVHPIYPDPEFDTQFWDCLFSAAPPLWDSEDLGALFSQYVRSQDPASHGTS